MNSTSKMRDFLTLQEYFDFSPHSNTATATPLPNNESLMVLSSTLMLHEVPMFQAAFKIIGTNVFNADKTNLSFSQALALMKAGHRLCRMGWHPYRGTSTWVCLADGFKNLEADKFWNKHTKEHAMQRGGSAHVNQYFLQRCLDGSVQMGWTPSQTDMMTDDWYYHESSQHLHSDILSVLNNTSNPDKKEKDVKSEQ